MSILTICLFPRSCILLLKEDALLTLAQSHPYIWCFVSLTFLRWRKNVTPDQLLFLRPSDNCASCRTELQLLHWGHTAAPCPVCSGAGGELRWGRWLRRESDHCHSLHERPDQACRSHSGKKVQLNDDYDLVPAYHKASTSNSRAFFKGIVWWYSEKKKKRDSADCWPLGACNHRCKRNVGSVYPLQHTLQDVKLILFICLYSCISAPPSLFSLMSNIPLTFPNAACCCTGRSALLWMHP